MMHRPGLSAFLDAAMASSPGRIGRIVERPYPPAMLGEP
jgi:hypothetical protein